MSKSEPRQKQSGWQTFLKSVAFTLAAVALIALGFFGAMIINGFFL